MSDFRRQRVDSAHPDFTIGFLLGKLGEKQLGPEGSNGISCAFAEKQSTGGFISDIYRLIVQFRDGRARFSCIFKVPNLQKIDSAVLYDEEIYAEITEWCFRVHNSECRFYTEMAHLLQSAPIPLPFRLPEVYFSRPCPSMDCISGGFLLMEDLCATIGAKKGVAQVELADGLNKEQVESTVRALAAFHAISLWLPPELIDSFTLKTDLDFVDEKLHVSDRLMGMPDAREVFEPRMDALKMAYKQAGLLQPDEHKQFGMAPVQTHGDFWSNNLFFECADDGTPGNQLDAVFDWQTNYSGTGINDLVRLIYVCVDDELRREHFKEWLRLYSTTFNSALEKMGIDEEGTDGRGLRRRPLELVTEVAKWHSSYELCFQIFLLTNILGGEKVEAQRRKLLRRMSTLFDDCFADVVGRKEGMNKSENEVNK